METAGILYIQFNMSFIYNFKASKMHNTLSYINENSANKKHCREKCNRNFDTSTSLLQYFDIEIETLASSLPSIEKNCLVCAYYSN